MMETIISNTGHALQPPYSSHTIWFGILFIIFGTYFICIFIKREIFRRAHHCKEPIIFPEGGPLGLRLGYLLQRLKTTGELVDFPMVLYEKFGRRTTFSAYLFGVRVVASVNPDNLKAVLATQFNDFGLGTRHAHFKPLLGNGVFTLDGEGWKESRQMLRPQFAREQVAHVQTIEPHLQTLAKHIKTNNGGTFDIQELFYKLTVDTSTEFLFGESVHSLYDASIGLECDPEVAGFAEAFNETQKALAVRTYLQVLYFLYNPPSFKRNTKIVHKFAKRFVNRALCLTPKELEEHCKHNYTFLYQLAKHTRDPQVLQDQLLNIMVAGRDTTAGLLSFTIFELARHQNVWEKLKKEIYQHFGSGEDAQVNKITFETLKQCTYLKWVLNEILRLYPSVPINFRVATKDTTLPTGGGLDEKSPVFIGKGTTFAYSPYLLHRMPMHYGEDATVFRPERWADLKQLGWAYLPFNGGPRICLGQQFALTEASYTICRLAQMFPNLKSMDDSPDPCKKLIHLTMSHMDGVWIQMSE
ncbi:cytochrome P450 [Acetobacter pasteurianus]|nr:cytochrome P450 [Acetobacter pasteurianus]